MKPVPLSLLFFLYFCYKPVDINTVKGKHYTMKTGSRKGQASIQTIGAIVGVAAVLIAGVFFLQEVQALLSLILSNLLYTSVVAIGILTAVAGYQWAGRQENLSAWIIPVGGVLMIVLVVGGVVATGQLTDALTSYTVTVEADIDGGTISDVEYNGVSVTNIESGRSLVLNPQQGSVFTTNYRVEVEITCNGEVVGSSTISGEAPSDGTTEIAGVPGDSQCLVTGTIKEPLDAIGANTQTARFVTP